MFNVDEVADLTGRAPRTIRRWIRSGALIGHLDGRKYVIEEEDFFAFTDEHYLMFLPPEWRRLSDGSPIPNVVKIARASRDSHPRRDRAIR